MKQNFLKSLLRVLPILILAGGAPLLLSGCSSSYTRAEFEEMVASTTLDTRGSVYYKGRKDGHDHFKLQWNVGSRNVRLAVSESPVKAPFPYTSDETFWRAASFMNLNGADLSRAIADGFNPRRAGPTDSTIEPQ